MRPTRPQKYFVAFINTLAALLLQQRVITAINVQTAKTMAAADMHTIRTTAAATIVDNVSRYNNSNVEGVNIDVADEDFQRLVERKLQEEAAAGAAIAPIKDRLLSRKRRYLIFPEGSSFQLVWDGIYGVVDFTNYIVLGITVALAWELPSKPQEEVIEEIADRLKGESADESSDDSKRRNDTAGNLIYVDTKSKSKLQLQYPKQQHKPTQPKTQQPQSMRPNYIHLATGKTPSYSYYYANAPRWPPAFRPPMHNKYYYSNSNNNGPYYNAYRRPTDIYYRRPIAYPSTVGKKPAVANFYKPRPSDWRRKDSNFYNNYDKYNKYSLPSTKVANPFSKWTAQQRPKYGFTPQTQNAGSAYPWWNLGSRVLNSLRRKAIPARRIDSVKSQPQQQQSAAGNQRQPPVPAASAATASTNTVRKHRIYPVFGKRSIRDEQHPTHVAANGNTSQQPREEEEHVQHHRHRRGGIAGPTMSRMERIHVRHHRSTRHSLYEKIEKYLDKLGVEYSHHCILRALCETGQKSGERVPGSFVGELMRAVFTLPEALDEERVAYKNQRYDAANVFGGDCAARYGHCKKSLWQMHFVE